MSLQIKIIYIFVISILSAQTLIQGQIDLGFHVFYLEITGKYMEFCVTREVGTETTYSFFFLFFFSFFFNKKIIMHQSIKLTDVIWLLQLVISSPLIHAFGNLSQASTGIWTQVESQTTYPNPPPYHTLLIVKCAGLGHVRRTGRSMLFLMYVILTSCCVFYIVQMIITWSRSAWLMTASRKQSRKSPPRWTGPGTSGWVHMLHQNKIFRTNYCQLKMCYYNYNADQ